MNLKWWRSFALCTCNFVNFCQIHPLIFFPCKSTGRLGAPECVAFEFTQVRNQIFSSNNTKYHTCFNALANTKEPLDVYLTQTELLSACVWFILHSRQKVIEWINNNAKFTQWTRLADRTPVLELLHEKKKV